MSTLKVETVKIDDIISHPNADKLQIAVVKGWNIIVGKEQFKAGDLAVFIPEDSVITEELEAKVFGANSKIKLTNHRIRIIKIRGCVSQGLLVSYDLLGINKAIPEGVDFTERLGVKKYEPPLEHSPQFKGNQVKKRLQNPLFHKYTDIENFKNHNKLFQPEDEVFITEKIHGSCFSAGYLPFAALTFWDKIKKFLRLTPEYEFVVRSHNVQLSFDSDIRNIYIEIFQKYKLDKVLKKGEIISGEVYGSGVQKGYTYGCENDERKLAIFDIKQDGKYLDYIDFVKRTSSILESMVVNGTELCHYVPTLFRGKFKDADLEKLASGDSKFAPSQKVIEGVVIKSTKEEHCHLGRKVLKYINPEYLLLKSNSEFH